MNKTPKIITVNSKKLVGHHIEMSIANNKNQELFSGFMPNKKEIKHAVSEDVFEVMVYDTNYFKGFSPINNYIKWASVEVSNYNTIPENMETLDLTGGLYAVFNYKGLPAGFGELMSYIMMHWLPQSQYQLDNRPHFNILGEKYKKGSTESEEDVFIPIKLK